MKRFTGKVAFVTGGASGLGKAIAERLSDEAAFVAIADINEIDGQSIADAINGIFIKMDVSKPESVKVAIESVVNSWHEIIDVNLNGAFYVLKYGLNHLVKQQKQSGGGVIINTTSVAGIKPAMVPPYNCSKAALISLTKEAAREYELLELKIFFTGEPKEIRSFVNESFITDVKVTPAVVEFGDDRPTIELETTWSVNFSTSGITSLSIRSAVSSFRSTTVPSISAAGVEKSSSSSTLF
ncbi:unnamed protein product [Didymodactylos carnosus]|uniref:Uncharacterized protein n=1 Tax=Didymodactylos carnosus TaxID=1234261 RepID=A0A815PQC3_9BILA|nr:unnamed protein product [Didymodactylos carnosus]CAF1452446.1 unnamed protein product [Didymodactylos carnosus]CAF4110898.1 unnamed protein product [Didymodactylos carnosus]CAF4325387.1 unnamed protein product [Didymodactylos carnosus]